MVIVKWTVAKIHKKDIQQRHSISEKQWDLPPYSGCAVYLHEYDCASLRLTAHLWMRQWFWHMNEPTDASRLMQTPLHCSAWINTMLHFASSTSHKLSRLSALGANSIWYGLENNNEIGSGPLLISLFICWFFKSNHKYKHLKQTGALYLMEICSLPWLHSLVKQSVFTGLFAALWETKYIPTASIRMRRVRSS